MALLLCLLLETADPVLITVGAIGGLLPDIDVSTSISGRLFPWISGYFESTMPHRSCTHSLVASVVIASASYGTSIFLPNLLPIASALTIGYTFGWFADCFTRSGVEMFWPCPVRCVCPGNRNLRLRTGSNAEYSLLIILIAIPTERFAIALSVFSINSRGGVLTQFNRLIGSTSGVKAVYNSFGGTHKIIVNIKGVRGIDRSKVDGQFILIEDHGTGFIVLEPNTNKIYKAATERNSPIVIEKITADVGKPAITTIETIFLDDEVIGEGIAQFNRTGAMVFVSGQLSVEDFDILTIPRDPYQFPFIQASPTNINLKAAPLNTVIKFLGDEFAKGSLEIKSIISSP